ncbi:MAG: OmpA family protein [Sedimentisphaerales bacterium]|nr:OmpA family protein [Sedimentisphaerales bacterium]
MRIVRITLAVLAGMALLSAVGCISETQYRDLQAQNRIQQQRIIDLEGELSQANVMLGQLQKKLQTCEEQNPLMSGAKNAEIVALEKTIEELKGRIKTLQDQLLKMPPLLPPVLIEQLRQFAQTSDLVEFDEEKGMLKFKSDLLFAPGSAQVEAKAAESVKTLAGILGGGEGAQFDIIVVGHTDDQPIKYSKAQHPTNWHLSVHRAVAVLQVLEKNGISSKRLSARGFGEFRPVAPNEPGNKGNPANRRVELYIVPSGT